MTLEQLREQCPYCGDSGDVHSPDGEWRGQCTCEAGLSLEIAYLRKENEKLKESLRYVIEQSGKWQSFATDRAPEDIIDTEEMKLARERAK